VSISRAAILEAHQRARESGVSEAEMVEALACAEEAPMPEAASAGSSSSISVSPPASNAAPACSAIVFS